MNNVNTEGPPIGWSDKQVMMRNPDLTKVSVPCDAKWAEHLGYTREHLWVKILEGDENTGIGMIENESLFNAEIKYGDKISYENKKYIKLI